MVDMANPYYSTADLHDQISFNFSLYKDLINTCGVDRDTRTQLWSGNFLMHLKRRLREAPLAWPPPLRNASGEWGAYYAPESYGLVYNDALMRPSFLEPLVEFGDTPQDGINPGNLTERRVGKTAEFLVVSNYPRDEGIQSMFKQQVEERASILSRSLEGGTAPDHPCGGAATNSDIFLYVLAMATAACGGVQSILESLHKAFYVLNLLCCQQRPARVSHAASCISRSIPTYEFTMAIFGLTLLVLLYVPVVLQASVELSSAFLIRCVKFDSPERHCTLYSLVVPRV